MVDLPAQRSAGGADDATGLRVEQETAGASLLLAALIVQVAQAKPGRNSSRTGRTGTSASS